MNARQRRAFKRASPKLGKRVHFKTWWRHTGLQVEVGWIVFDTYRCLHSRVVRTKDGLTYRVSLKRLYTL